MNRSLLTFINNSFNYYVLILEVAQLLIIIIISIITVIIITIIICQGRLDASNAALNQLKIDFEHRLRERDEELESARLEWPSLFHMKLTFNKF